MDAHKPWQTLILACLGFVLCCWAYLELAALPQRTTIAPLLYFYSLAFAGLLFLYFSKIRWEIALAIGLVFRLMFWNHIPILSQDFYRFLWDGHLNTLGINPYDFKPNLLIEKIESPLTCTLYEGMGGLSQQNYSNYPPASQWLFALTAWLGGQSLMAQLGILRFILIVGDVVAAIGLLRLVKSYAYPKQVVWGCYLNPLLIVEATGNLHSEGLMLAAVAWGIWFLKQNKRIGSAFFFAMSVAIKLVPLIWLPLLLQHMDKKGLIRMIGYGSLFSVFFWSSYLNPTTISHYSQTIGLWFSNFEFNASWYYLIREWGYQLTGYNIIRTLGKITPWLLTGTIGLFAIWPRKGKEKLLWQHALGLLSLYYFTATTIHPWYVIHLVFLGSLTQYRYSWIWSYTVFFSYLSYQNVVVEAPPWLVWLEYLPVYTFLFWEIWNYNIRSRLTSVSFK